MSRPDQMTIFVFCLLFSLSPAVAQLKVGQKVYARGHPDPVCVTKADLRNYMSSNDACAFGSAGDCKSAKSLEDRKICGFHYKTYTVVALQEEPDTSLPRQTGLVQVSAIGHESQLYWGDIGDFSRALKPGDKVQSYSSNPDPVCIAKTDVETYHACRESDTDCASAKKLEEKKACGFQYDKYTVVSVEDQSGFIQLSPAGDESKRYWAEMDDFFTVSQ